jgi:hypothetical protein
MTTDSGTGHFDERAAGRDAGDQRLDDPAARRQVEEDAGDGTLEEERQERQAVEDKLNEAFEGR